MPPAKDGSLLVVALCADWCYICKGFAPAFARLAHARARDRFEWVDIEDESAELGGVEVDDFPTLAIFRGGVLLHCGAVRADEASVARLLDALDAREARSAAEEGAGAGAGSLRPLGRGDLLALLRLHL